MQLQAIKMHLGSGIDINVVCHCFQMGGAQADAAQQRMLVREQLLS